MASHRIGCKAFHKAAITALRDKRNKQAQRCQWMRAMKHGRKYQAA